MNKLICRQKYSRNNYNYRSEIEQRILQSLPIQIVSKCHASKMIRLACNVIRINLFECSLLCWLLMDSKFNEKNLISSAKQLSVAQQDHNKELLLLLLLNAYHVKSYLAEYTCPKLNSDLLKLLPTFSQIYKIWRPKVQLANLSLSQINTTFEEWTLKYESRRKIDYNELVNKILDLSKTYNVNSGEIRQQQPPKKKRKLNPQINDRVQFQKLEQYHRQEMNLRSSKKNIWQQDQRQDEGILQMNPLRKSLQKGVGYNNFQPSFEMLDSKSKLFHSRNVNNSFLGLNNSIGPLFNSVQSNARRFKNTNSFDSYC